MFKKFDDLKKQFSEKWKNFESRLLESNTFNLLKEKYQSLDILQKKLIKYLSVFFVLVILTYLPFSYFFSSSSHWRSFKEKQTISLGLLKVRNKMSYSVLRYSQNQLTNKIERIIEKYSTSDFELKHKKSLFQKEGSIYQINFDVHISHLNVKQVVKLGTELNSLSQVRLSSITVEENKKFPKHYDVAYKLSAFVSTEQKQRISPRRKRRSPLYKDAELNTGKKAGFSDEATDDQLKTKDRLKRKKGREGNLKDSESQKDRNRMGGNIKRNESQKDRNKMGGNIRKREIPKDKNINLEKENKEEIRTINL